MENIDPPKTRSGFERNLNLLHRQMADGKLHFAKGLARAVEGLLHVRYLPNGRADLLSVDESARLQANMMAKFAEQHFPELQNEIHNPTEDSTDTDDTELSESPDR